MTFFSLIFLNFIELNFFTIKSWLCFSNLIGLFILLFFIIIFAILLKNNAQHVRFLNLISAFFLLINFMQSSIEFKYEFDNLNLSFNQNTTLFVNVFLILATFTTILFFLGISDIFFSEENLKVEFSLLIWFIYVSAIFLISSVDFISILILIECIAFCSYVLVGFERKNKFSTTSALKYLILAAIPSGFFVLGIALLYYYFGTFSQDYLTLIFLNLNSNFLFNNLNNVPLFNYFFEKSLSFFEFFEMGLVLEFLEGSVYSPRHLPQLENVVTGDVSVINTAYFTKLNHILDTIQPSVVYQLQYIMNVEINISFWDIMESLHTEFLDSPFLYDIIEDLYWNLIVSRLELMVKLSWELDTVLLIFLQVKYYLIQIIWGPMEFLLYCNNMEWSGFLIWIKTFAFWEYERRDSIDLFFGKEPLGGVSGIDAKMTGLSIFKNFLDYDLTISLRHFLERPNWRHDTITLGESFQLVKDFFYSTAENTEKWQFGISLGFNKPIQYVWQLTPCPFTFLPTVPADIDFSFLTILNTFSIYDNTVTIIILIILFLLTNLGFKLTAAPFHSWAPSVYGGSPLATLIFLSIFSKLTIFFICIWLFTNTFNIWFDIWQPILLIIAFMSVFVSILGAFSEKIFKRFFVYSSIGHVGFMLFGLAVLNLDGIVGSVDYLILYIISSFIIWFIILHLTKKTTTLVNLKGLAFNQPFLGVIFTITIFSLSGIPPMGGFFVKYEIFYSLVNSSFFFLGYILLLLTVISFFYYLRIIKIIYFENNKLFFKNKNLNDIKLRLISICIFILPLYSLYLENPIAILLKEILKISLF